MGMTTRYVADDGRKAGEEVWVVLDTQTGETVYRVPEAFDLPTSETLTEAIADHLNHGELTPEEVRAKSW